MLYINHRINSTSQLEDVPEQNGVELDIRYHKNDLVLHHDPFGHHEGGVEKFESFLSHWHHQGVMILNVKSEGVERDCIMLMQEYQIKQWFFLDLSMPYCVRYAQHAQQGTIAGFSPDNLAVRFSEYEPIEYALAFAQKAGWVWIDCFTHLPLDESSYQRLKSAGYKICLVSPELQNHSLEMIADFRAQCEGFSIDAVCTKRPDLWGQE